ncbi:glycoside hydrolase [Candidatus Epulonipiscium fishelsonii]|uniref:Glycoside hydrolase n=1 Tax=Candidatus Epulonipiscium fishelsonii TaxID=77094 RepID=A0ACC8X808_9FIRM|nr:glycoside hydrolase [Epulopiscium sp. SCG-B11WGA-EpuloA1]ONI41143.1 glycoside hydrolase [Epulopiscium sp. SCG-B05WGA-EpuloA1]
MIKQFLNDNWKIRAIDESEKIVISLPNSVYQAYFEAGKIDNPFFRDNEDLLLPMMDKEYVFNLDFNIEESFIKNKSIDIVFEGLDTLATITLNGVKVGKANNMHRTWRFDVKNIIKVGINSIEIMFNSSTKYIKQEYEKLVISGAPETMLGFPYLRKAHCMFGWDWGPHMPDIGIFRDVYLEATDLAKIDNVYIRQIHKNGEVTLNFEIEDVLLTDGNVEYKIDITSPEGQTTTYHEYTAGINIENPKLWWPNGLGEQPLYKVDVVQKVNNIETDKYTCKIGLRELTMHIEKDEWGESFAHQINGIDVFAMGADYIPEDNLISRVTYETTYKLLEQCKIANFNTIRVWGGGYYPNDYFFEICDELGLMVWQDFMFACAVYELTEEFEENVTQELIDNIKRIRNHACLALWCGNNEMEMFVEQGVWVDRPSQKSDYVKMYEYIFPKLVKKYSPDTFYWPASPSSGGAFDEPNGPNRGDVHYWDVWHGNQPFTKYREFYFRYLSEFGFQSFPSVKTIETFAIEEDKNVFSYVMEKHQRSAVANGKIINYLYQTYLYPTSFELVIYASQLLQADAVRYGVEHFRRNRGRCMGAIYWQLNDCWPVTSWASIDYYGRWKALHYYAKRFFAPLMLSCEEEGMLTQNVNINDANFNIKSSAKLNIANETQHTQVVGIKWSLRKNDCTIIKEGTLDKVEVEALSSLWLEQINFDDIDIRETYFTYSMYQNGECISESSVIFTLPKFFKFLNPELEARIEDDEIIITAKKYAKSVEILNNNEDFVLSDNYFDMNAGEKRVKILSGSDRDIKVRSIYDIR